MTSDTDAPSTFIARGFFDTVERRLEAYDESLADYEDALYEAHKLDIRLRKKKKTDENDQTDLSLMYDEVLGCARECVLFLGFCHKNIGVLPRVMAELHQPVYNRLGLMPKLFAQPDHLAREFDYIRKTMFEALRDLERHFTPDTEARRAHSLYRGDPYCITVLHQARLAPEHFNDWVEVNFLRTFRIPLGKFTCSPFVEGMIAREISSDAFSRRTVNRIITQKLQGDFPGLSLDGMPLCRAHFNAIRKELPNHVFQQAEPRAKVIRFAPAAT